MKAIPNLDIVLIAVAVLLTTATQLRPDGIPVGMGEILLVVWMLWRILVVAVNPISSGRYDAAQLLIVFWLIFMSVLVLALAISYSRGTWDEAGAAHDFIALILSAVFSVLLVQSFADQNRARIFCRSLFLASAIVLVLLLLLAAGRGTVFGVNPWYAAFRFTGWSLNPNQLGLLLAPLPFLSIWALQSGTESKAVKTVGLSVLVVAGVLCLSDALFLSWGTAGVFLAGVYWLKSIARRGGTRKLAFLTVVLLPSVMLVAIIWATTGLIGQIVEVAVGAYENRGQGSLRLLIWSHGYEAFSESPFIGHGPGSFAGIAGAFDGFEAHNTFVDIATKSGLVGLSAYVSLILAIHVRLLRTGQFLLLGAFASVTVFSIFHYVLRQPIYWAVVVVCLRFAYGHVSARSGSFRRSAMTPSGAR